MNIGWAVWMLAALPASESSADELLTKAQALAAPRSQSALEGAVVLLTGSLDKHGGEARIHARLSELYGELAYWGFKSPKDVSSKCKLAAFKASELRANSAEALAAMGYSSLYVDFDFPGAEMSFKKAIEANPKYAPAHRWYSRCLLSLGKIKDAQAAAKKAVELEPKSAAALLDLGWTQFAANEFDLAADSFRKAIEAEPSCPQAHMYLGLTMLKQTKKAEGYLALEKAVELSGREVWAVTRRGAGQAVAGDPKKGEEALAEVSTLAAAKKFLSAYDMAMIYAAIAEKKTAFNWLEQAMAERAPRLLDLRYDPLFYRLHTDSRFHDILKQLNLPDMKSP